jgi:translation initiation factor 2 subunit 1
MVKSRHRFPREGDFVVGKVVNVQSQYVYVDLLDYEGLPSEDHARGMIHISEVSSRWVKNIRNHVRIGERIVLRVTRVDPRKGHVDLSIRRTNSAQRKTKMKDWKYGIKLENLLQFLADEVDELSLDDAYEMIGFPVLEYFNDNYQETVEELKENGPKILDNLTDAPEEIKEIFLRIVNENVEISTINIVGKLKLKYIDEDGVEKIKETLKEAKAVLDDPKETRQLKISYIAAPFYRIEVISKDYLDAENILSDLVEVVQQKVDENNGSFEFIRD